MRCRARLNASGRATRYSHRVNPRIDNQRISGQEVHGMSLCEDPPKSRSGRGRNPADDSFRVWAPLRSAMQFSCAGTFSGGIGRLSTLTPIFPVTLFPATIPGNSPDSPRHISPENLSHRLYLDENNNQTPKPLFSFLYNGFRGSRFIRICRLRRHSHILLRRALAPAARLYLAACRASDL
jgi:hypothetical protein